MSNVSYEQQLIESYWDFINSYHLKLLKKNCKSKNYSDLEYIDSITKVHWRIEAKSHMSKDAYNAVHKIFGELLKETGRTLIPDTLVKYGILLDGRYCPEKKISGKDFFAKYFGCINTQKYKEFGLLIPVDVIIVYDIQNKKVEKYKWSQFIGETDD